MAKSSKQKNRSANSGDSSRGSVKAKRTRKTVPRESPQQRSSIYRGVTRHRWTGRYEAHLWDKNCWNESQNKKGRQVYLGKKFNIHRWPMEQNTGQIHTIHNGVDPSGVAHHGASTIHLPCWAYDDEAAAAHAYDSAALKYWGQDTILNFPLSTYQNELLDMEAQTKEEYISSLRRKSSGFSRGVSKYRGVARHHHNGRWEARIGRVFGNKYLYLGTYATQEEAATAYDMAAIEYRGVNAVTNFDLSRYVKLMRPDGRPNPGCGSDDSTLLRNPDQQLALSTFLNHHHLELPPATGADDEASGGALGLLLQSSSKLKEILEQTTVAVPCCDSPSLEPPRSSFPDDIQTSFEFPDSSSFAEEHDVAFGNFDSFVSPMFQCGIDNALNPS